MPRVGAGEQGSRGAGVEELLQKWWELRIARQREIDASIAAAADQEFLYDRPYQDKSIVRVAGPFTVESLSPHRVLTVDADDELVPAEGKLFREPPPAYDGDGQIEVEIRGVDVFHPQSGEVRSAGPEGIACWFIDTEYNEESFFVRQAYFLGMNDPYGALRTTLKAEIDEAAWESLYRAVSRPFPRPTTGRIAVKVINHLGDEVMKVYSVQ